VHGANRLASNSLLETVVFARRAVERLFEAPAKGEPAPPPQPTAGARALPRREPIAVEAPSAQALRQLMWTDVGIVRDGAGLEEAAATLATWESMLPPVTDRASRELRSLVTCARLATEAALLREESRGAHFRTDFAEPVAAWQRHLIYRGEVAPGERAALEAPAATEQAPVR